MELDNYLYKNNFNKFMEKLSKCEHEIVLLSDKHFPIFTCVKCNKFFVVSLGEKEAQFLQVKEPLT